MDESSPHQQPLLLSIREEFGHVKKPLLLLSLTKWILKFVMWVIFIAWVAFIFLAPLEPINELYTKWIHSENSLLGTSGRVILVYCGPVMIIAFLGIVLLIISGEEQVYEKKSKKTPSFRLWTFPIIVDGPFGVVSAAELIGIILFSVYVIWAMAAFTDQNLSILPEFMRMLSIDKTSLMLELTGVRFGFIGLICMAFLFLPVARGSVLLRLVDIPFEHATRYHVWLGHLTMFLFTLHGLLIVIAWTIQGRLLQELTEWKNTGFANLPGVISLLAGLLMWVTSLPPVRRVNFELFFYTHQLYVVFVVFLALHVGDYIFSMAAAGIFLFMLDRFLRFCQSRRTVDILSASCLPCGTVELVISKPASLRYNALSWIFIQIRELSWLQWHPFSVSSSPLDGKDHLSVLIKVLGGWTGKLRGNILKASLDSQLEPFLRPNSKITASIEGPYGHASPYHLMYENLILVAGGIGISPFLAILSDILHHINDGKACLPRNILLVWAVKKSNELPLLHTFDMKSICPFFYNTLNLEIQTFVTRELEPPLEEGHVDKYTNYTTFPALKKCGISILVGTGNIIWSGVYVVVSSIGLVICMASLNFFYVRPFNITYWWYKGLLLLVCMTASVLIFGGLVIGLWHIWERKTTSNEVLRDDEKTGTVQHNENGIQKELHQKGFTSTIQYGQRPDFKEIFESKSNLWGNVDIGVIICGPPTLQTSVAKECRAQNLRRRSDSPIFHFNSHSFDL